MTAQGQRVLVKDPAYRRFSASRIAMDDAVAAILIGTRLGRSFLSEQPSGAWLPDVADIEDAQRLYRTVGEADELILRGERYLAYMAIPLSLSILQTYVADVFRIMEREGKRQRLTDPAHMSWGPLSEELIQLGLLQESHLSSLLSFVVMLRNRIAHDGGTQGSQVRSTYLQLPRRTRDWWEVRSKRALEFGDSRDHLRLEPPELRAALAVILEVAKEINSRLIEILSPSTWARIVVEDYALQAPTSFKQKDRLVEKILRFSSEQYGPIGLTEDDVLQALTNR